jgi:hypothetical protein
MVDVSVCVAVLGRHYNRSKTTPLIVTSAIPDSSLTTKLALRKAGTLAYWHHFVFVSAL